MKILLFGNVANNFYRLGQALNKTPGQEAVLLLSQSEEPGCLPSHDDPSLEGFYPEWVKLDKKFRLRRLLFYPQGQLLKELRAADLVILSSLNVLAAFFLRKQKVLFYVTGGDLTVFPFWRRQARFILDQRERISINTLIMLLRALPLSILMRIAIRNCDYIHMRPFLPYSLAVKKLRIPVQNQLDVHLPLAIDLDNFRMKDKSELKLDKKSVLLFEKFEFRILAPSRLLTNDHSAYVETGQYKHNDLMLDVIARLLEASPSHSVGLFFIDRGSGDRGETLKMKKRIQELHLSDNVVWLKPRDGSAFNRAELIDFYSISNLVVDDLGVGWFGSVSLEALSCSRPVLCYVDENVMGELYPWHPFISSLDIDEIVQRVLGLMSNPDKAREIGAKGRTWVEIFHSTRAIQDRTQEIIKMISSVEL